jgi:SP family myo-inositol transporter-like MFS transporter 13
MDNGKPRPSTLPAKTRPGQAPVFSDGAPTRPGATVRGGIRIVPTEQTHLRLHDEAGNAPNPKPWLLYILTAISSLSGFLYGYDIGIISGAMVLIREDFDVSSVWQESVVGSSVAAAAVFALLGGFFNDKTGRKPVIILASLVYTVGALCSGLAPNRSLLLLGRIIVGAGIGNILFLSQVFVLIEAS